MEIISYVALILLSLVGYSGGSVFQSGRGSEPKPSILDLILIVFVWTSAIYVKMTFPFNRWLLILVYLLASFLIAFFIAVVLKRRPVRGDTKPADQLPSSRSLWERWKDFSKKLGSFQSRSLLSLFYFLIVFPFALVVKFFADPLRIKHKNTQSHWLERKALHSGRDDFRKQF